MSVHKSGFNPAQRRITVDVRGVLLNLDYLYIERVTIVPGSDAMTVLFKNGSSLIYDLSEVKTSPDLLKSGNRSEGSELDLDYH